MRTHLVAVGTVLLLSASCEVAKNEVLARLPPIEVPVESLPRLPDGKYLLIQASSARVEIDPTLKDPITAAGGCTDLLTYCFASGKELDACVREAPKCSTATPWKESTACCPADCQTAYVAARDSGSEAFVAFDQVFFGQPDCLPGVAAALRGETP